MYHVILTLGNVAIMVNYYSILITLAHVGKLKYHSNAILTLENVGKMVNYYSILIT